MEGLDIEDRSMRGKVCLITGATSGIGKGGGVGVGQARGHAGAGGPEPVAV